MRILNIAAIAFAAVTAAALPLRSVAAQTFVEVDPIAYTLLRGYSGHVGRIAGPLRAEVGVFGVRVPGSIQGNPGWTMEMGGTGLNVDYIGRGEGGVFVGVGTGLGRYRFTLDSTGLSEARTQWSAGARAGYRWFPRKATHFYLAPWASLDYSPNAKSVVVSGQRYEQSHWQFFPTVHLGWRF